MKRLLALIVFLASFSSSKAYFFDDTFGSYTNKVFTINLSQKSKVIVFDNLKGYNNYQGEFDKAYIDDPEPFNPQSYAYAIFDGKNI